VFNILAQSRPNLAVNLNLSGLRPINLFKRNRPKVDFNPEGRNIFTKLSEDSLLKHSSALSKLYNRDLVKHRCDKFISELRLKGVKALYFSIL